MTSRIGSSWTSSGGRLVKVERKGRFPVAPKDDRTIDGVTFASAKEAGRYCELKRLQRARQIDCLELQPAFRVEINGQPYCTYKADFSYIDLRSNRPVVEDVKSSGTEKDAAHKLRKKAAELAHGIKVIEVLR